ncbi:MAG: uracil-DNA glycosylase [Clostridia bacterium]|nr:uracil-DNA glycosylase [Clostridia bacterium]
MSKHERLKDIEKQLGNQINEYFNTQYVPIVFGEGNTDARMVLVGEAPGKQEIEQKRPFVGQAGKNLQKFLDYLKIQRKDIYITNVVKFRPYKINPSTGRKINRKPNTEEIEICRNYLKAQINTIYPQLIVSLGNVPLQTLTDDNSIGIGQVHGTIIDIRLDDKEYKLFPLYHPASLIYRRSLIQTYNQDLDKLSDYLKSSI